jgi:chromosomal replication initiation ATPase DnaA
LPFSTQYVPGCRSLVANGIVFIRHERRLAVAKPVDDPTSTPLGQLAGWLELDTPPVCLVMGPSGSGKTTLLRSFLARFPRVVWTTANDWTDGLLDAIRGCRADEWRRGIVCNQDLLIVEHLEDLAEKPVVLSEFLEIVEARRKTGCRTLLSVTSRTHQKSWRAKLKRRLSRTVIIEMKGTRL